MRIPLWDGAGRRLLALGAVAVLAGLTAAGPPAGERAAPDRVGRLIAQLGSRKYAARRAAARALDELGTPCLPALAKAAASPDPEVRRLAGRLARAIRKREEADRLLAPTRVRLAYRDRPVAEAVADLARKTGFTIVLDDKAKAKVAGRKVTLETGETDFWPAFDRFCRKAGLVEQGLAFAAAKNVPAPTTNNPYVGAYSGPNGGNAIPVKQDARLVLEDGKPPELPTGYFKGLRVRALPPATPLEGWSAGDGERTVVLDVTLEPKARLHKLIDVRVGRAADRRGKDAPASVKRLREEENYGMYYNPYMASVPQYVSRLEHGMDEGNFRRVLVRVKAADRLAELKGSLIASVQQTGRAVIVADNILKARGKSFTTGDGTTLALGEVTRKPDGSVTIKADTTTPLGQGIMSIRITNGVVQVRRQGSDKWEPAGVNPDHLKLLDKAGKKFRLTNTTGNGVNFAVGQINQSLVFTFQPEQGQGPPAKLVYYGVKTTVVEVPFALKNVPLP